MTTGLILQEPLQGFVGARQVRKIVQRFRALPFLQPTLEDHVEAARIRNDCRRRGNQIQTIDALLAALCLRHRLTLLTTDRDFDGIAEAFPLKVWGPIE